MADDSPRQPDARLVLSLVVSREPAFLATTEALVARVGEHAGCAGEDARRLGRAVRQTLGGIIEGAPESLSNELEVAFSGNGRVVKVDVTCACASNGSASLEDALTGDAAAIRGLVDRLEFLREGQRQVCRLTQQVRSGR